MMRLSMNHQKVNAVALIDGNNLIAFLNATRYNKVRMEVDGMEVLEKEDICTIEDIYALPDGIRAELMDGKIYYMAPPSWSHQKISSNLHNQISITPAVKYRRFYLLKFPSAALLSIVVALATTHSSALQMKIYSA